MQLTFPRKFTHGQKIDNVDVYGELFLWPDGHFQLMAHIRNRDPIKGCCINVAFALLDQECKPIGIFGMPADEAWCVAPWGDLKAGQRYDELFGKVSAEKLMRTSMAALLFRPQGQELNMDKLSVLANTGCELMFCPAPD